MFQIVAAIATLLIIALVVALAVVLSSHAQHHDLDRQEVISGLPGFASKPDAPLVTWEEAMSGAFRAKNFNGSWWGPEEIQWQDAEGNLVLWNVNTNGTTVLVSKELLNRFQGRARYMIRICPFRNFSFNFVCSIQYQPNENDRHLQCYSLNLSRLTMNVP